MGRLSRSKKLLRSPTKMLQRIKEVDRQSRGRQVTSSLREGLVPRTDSSRMILTTPEMRIGPLIQWTMTKMGGSLIEGGLVEMMWMTASMTEEGPRGKSTWVWEKMMRQKRSPQGGDKGRGGRDKTIMSMTRRTLTLRMTHLMRMVVQARERRRRGSIGRSREGERRRLKWALILMISMIMMMRTILKEESNQAGNLNRRRRRSRRFLKMVLSLKKPLKRKRKMKMMTSISIKEKNRRRNLKRRKRR
jgi:hypothetical protein